jgi:hypothetical protein
MNFVARTDTDSGFQVLVTGESEQHNVLHDLTFRDGVEKKVPSFAPVQHGFVADTLI